VADGDFWSALDGVLGGYEEDGTKHEPTD
jgi:hypothetical protein